MSMAVRQDHALGVPGYYDQDFFGASKVPHEARVRLAIDAMRKVYEEVVGDGFYRPEFAGRYRAMIGAALPPSDVSGVLTKDEFCARFKAEMLRIAGPSFDDGDSIADYADQTGPTYFDDPEQRGEGPEACAQADVSYWGD